MTGVPPSSDRPRTQHLAFTLCVLALAACTIGLVWLVIDRADRARIPNYQALLALCAFGVVATLSLSTHWAAEPDDLREGVPEQTRISMVVVLAPALVAVYAALVAWVYADSGDRFRELALGGVVAVFAMIAASQARRFIEESHLPRRTIDTGAGLGLHLLYLIPLAYRSLPTRFHLIGAEIAAATALALAFFLGRRRAEIVEALPPDPPLLAPPEPGIDLVEVASGEREMDETEQWEEMPEIRRLL